MAPRQCVTGNPDDEIQVPAEIDFLGADFLNLDGLTEIGEAVLARQFHDLNDGMLIVDFRWKAKGGSSKGSDTLGKCIKLTGVSRHYALGSHFMVWIAADHVRMRRYRRYELEALLYHELCHIEITEDGYGTKGHDVELFFDEIRKYGLWRENLRPLASIVQPNLPGFAEREPEPVGV